MKALAVKNTSHESLGGNHKPAKQAQLAVNRGVAAFPANIPYSRQPSICPCDGGCPRCSNEGVIQLKLTLGQPNDKYEQEADRVADQVVNKPGISTIPRQDSGSRPETVPTTPLTNQITPFVRREPIEEEDEKEKEPVQAKLLPFPIQKQAQAEVEEQPEEEEEEEEQVQADIQRMAGGREEIQPKGLKENGRTAGGNFKARLAAGQGAGQILPTGVLSYLAARLGADFSGVRVHTDSTAVEMSAELKARAFTYGSDIYFNQGNYDPASSRGLWLLTHELTHVMQQGKADPQPTAKVRKSIEKEAEEEKELDVQAKAQTASISSAPPGIQRSFLDSVTGAAGAVWDATAGQLIDAAGEVIEMSSEFFWGLLETVAPAFAPIVREIADKGILGFLKDKISPALNHLFDGLNDNSTLLGPLLGTYMEMAAQAGEIVIALASGDCRPLFAAVNRLKETLSKMAGDAWNAVTDFFAPVGAFFSDVWQSFGAPVLDWLGQTATDVWNEISGLGQQIWAWTQPFRDKVGGAWDWVKGKLGIGGQEAEGDSEGGLVQWIQAKAEEAWSIIKEELQPVIEPIQAVVEKVEAILPLDAIFNLRETIQGWLSKAEAMGQAMGDDGSNVAEQQTSLRDEILPAILAFIESLRVRLIDTGLWISEKIGAIVDTVSGFIDALMSLPLVSGLQAAVMWIQTALLQLADWYRTSVVVVFNLVGDGLVLLSSFIRPILDILNQIVETLKNLMGKLPDLILGPVWWLLPACIKNPIKDFILNQILLRIPFFQDFLALGDLWQKFKATAMTILKQIFVDGDILGALWTYFKAILGIFGLPPQLITNIIVKAAQALGDIIANPIGFIINILKAVKEGFVRFFANILKHLMGGVTDWLFGQIAEAGITLPQDFSLKSILGLVFQILGLTMEKIWQKLAAKIGPDKVEKLKTGINLATGAWEWVKLAATEEPAAIWDKLKEKLSDLWTTVITGVVTWVNSVIIVQGTKWLLSFLDVSGIMPTITATIALYKAVESFFEYLKEMLEIVNTVFNGIADIAKGAIGTAAGFLESALANSVPIIIAFLANQFGLGRLGSKLREIIGAVQEKVDGAIDWLIEKAVSMGKAFLDTLIAGAGAVKEGVAGLLEWWLEKRAFTTGTETHELFYQNGQLMISSDEPKSIAELDNEIENLFIEGVSGDQEKIKTHREVAKNLKKEIETRIEEADEGKDESIETKIEEKYELLLQSLAILINWLGNVGWNLRIDETTPGEMSDEVGEPKIIKPRANRPQTSLEIAYVANVPTTPSPEDKAPVDIADLYYQDGFDRREDAKHRFGLIVGVNTYRRFDPDEEKTVKADLQSRISFSWDKFMIAAFAFFWEPIWKYIGSGEKVEFKKVRDYRSNVKRRKRGNEEVERIKAMEKRSIQAKSIPYGRVRDRISQHATTREFTKILSASYSNVYHHVGDADAVSLKAAEGQGPGIDAQTISQGLFTRYDAIIANHKEKSGGEFPAIVSGGYEFRMKTMGGVNEDALRVIANQIDQSFRQAIGQINPFVLYFPEPNTLVKIEEGEDTIEASFGIGDSENKSLVKDLRERRQLQNKDVVYNTEAAIETDSERFFAKDRSGNPIESIIEWQGGTMEGLSKDHFEAIFKANQMHASRSRVVARLLEEYYDPLGETIDMKERRKIEGAFKKAYDAHFPNAYFLSGDHWSELKTELKNYDVAQGWEKLNDNHKIRIGRVLSLEVINEIRQILVAGATAVKQYMIRLFGVE